MNLNTAGVCVLAAASGVAMGGVVTPVSGSIVVREGDAVAGSTVASLNSPFTNGNGQVGAVLALADGRRAVWYDTGVIFTSDMALPDDLSGGEGTMGIGNNGQFIYSPSFNGNDAVFGNNGLILADGDPIPGMPGFNSTFNSRPQMIDDGSGFWVGGVNDGAGGTSTASRVLFRSNPDGSINRVLGAGDAIANSGGLVIDTGSGIDFDYHVSGNGANMINGLIADAPTSSDAMVAVNGSMVAREGSGTGQGDNWANFDHVSINNSGNFVFSGDTDGAAASDEFIAYNGAISLREGMSLDGLTLGGSVNALSINNNDESVFIWSTVEATETLFYAADPMDFASAIALLSVGDLFDENNDGVGDWIIDDFNASGVVGPGLDFAEDGRVFAEVDLASLDGATTFEAIISVAVPAPGAAGLLAMMGLAATRRRRA